MVIIVIGGLASIGIDHLVKAQVVTATIPVGTAPKGAVTPNGAYDYVAKEESNTVSDISTMDAITSPSPSPTISPTVSATASPSPSPCMHRTYRGGPS